MKRNLSLVVLLLISSIMYAQFDYWYFNNSFDFNKAFHIKDNDRTKTDVFGYDYDLELGARFNSFGVYMFYGEFKKAGFYNYGAGVDYYVDWFRWIDMSVGVAYSPVKEKDFRGVYVGVGVYHVRAVTTIYFNERNNVGLSLRWQLQDRRDTAKGYIFEGAVGITIKFNRQ